MISLIDYVKGVITLHADEKNKTETLRYLQSSGIRFRDLHEVEGGMIFTAPAKYKKDGFLLSHTVIKDEKGLFHTLKKSGKRPGIYAGIVIFIAGLIFSGLIVWDVELKTGGDENAGRIYSVLSECGISPGALKTSFDAKKAENTIMLKCPDVSYASVMLSGNIVEVRTDERLITPAPAKRSTPDLRAKEDGFIIRYETYNGKTVCEAGQTVKKGDVLISGTYDTFHHGTVTVNAEGRVFALVKRSFLCECKEYVTEKRYTGKEHVKTALTLFSKQLWQIKDSDPDKYDKQSTEETVTVFNTVKLPLSVTKSTFREYYTYERKISSSEAGEILEKDYEKQYALLTEGAEVQSEEKRVYYDNGAYKLYCEIWMITDIAG